jgi:UDP-glucose 4-epimerase
MILLTGASGFIGKHLLSSLVEKYGKDQVLAFTSVASKTYNYLLHNDYQFKSDYFTEKGYADSISTVIHAGAFTPKNSSQANDWKQANKNIFNTSVLLEADMPKLEKFVYLSTLDVYGKDEVISEKSPVEPASLYGYSKLYCEKMVTAWADANKKKAQVLRVGHVYGPGDEAYQKIIPVAIKKILSGESLQIFGSGNELRAFINIRDIVKAILKVIELPDSAGVINLVSDQSVSIRELVNKIIGISGRPADIETVETSIPGRNLVFDNSKMKKYLLETEIPLEEGLLEEWNYMKEKLG